MGYGLAIRLAAAGIEVVIGSRDPARAEQAAAEVSAAVAHVQGHAPASGLGNVAAAAAAGVVVVAVPPAAQEATLRAIAPAVDGKVIIDTTVSTAEGDPTRVTLGPEGASALRARALLGPGVRLVAGFHTVSGKLLANLTRPVECDILLAGDDPGAKEVAGDLARRIGTRAVDAGPLEVGGTLERMTAMIIGMNIRLKRRHIGLRLTGI